jgi:hypothetical protein
MKSSKVKPQDANDGNPFKRKTTFDSDTESESSELEPSEGDSDDEDDEDEYSSEYDSECASDSSFYELCRERKPFA